MIKKRVGDSEWFEEDNWFTGGGDDGEAAFWDEFWTQEEKADEASSGINIVMGDGKGGVVVLEEVKVTSEVVMRVD